MLKNDPKSSFLHFALAKEFENEGDMSKAQKCYENLRQIDPDYVGLYYHLAQNYYASGDYQKAIQIAQTGIEICTKVKDQHALSELQNLLMNYQIEGIE